MGDLLSLDIPALPEHVGTARLFVGAVARHFGYGEEAVEDLKIAVSEACSMSVRDRSAGAGGPVRVEIAASAGALRVQVIDAEGGGVPPNGSDPEPTPDSFARSVAADVIESLFPGAAIEVDPAGVRRISFELAQA